MNTKEPFGSKVPGLLIERIHEIPIGRALDLGCAAGATARYLAERGFTVDAVDWNTYSEFVEHPNIRLQRQDIAELSFQPESYDVVVASQVLQFFSRSVRSRLISDIARALKAGGVLFASSFTDGDQFLEIFRAEGWAEEEDLSLHAPDGRWVSFFRAGELREAAGQSLVVVHYAEFSERSTNRAGNPHRFGVAEIVARKAES